MPSVSHFLHRLKLLSIMSSISENRPAESISLMSVTKKALSSKLELILLSFLCVIRPLSPPKKVLLLQQ